MHPIDKIKCRVFENWKDLRQVESVARLLEEKTLQENEENYLLIKLILEKISSMKLRCNGIERILDFEIEGF